MIEAIHDSHQPLRVLYILGPLSPREWLERALDDGAAGAVQVTVTPSLNVGLEQLREQAYDVVVIDRDASDRPAADLLSAIQAGTDEHQAVLILADGEDRGEATNYLLAGASGYLGLRHTTTRELVWQLHAAAEQSQLQRDHRRMQTWQSRADQLQQQEVLGLLQEQITRFTWAARREDPRYPGTRTSRETPHDWPQTCRELLQAYLVMGQGHLADEVGRLADRLHDKSESLPSLLLAFAQAMHDLVQDRGTRSARHVVHRGNLLLFDLVLAWADRHSARTANEHFHRRSGL
jgi:DNA-binding NarL/FixJ family response regulator